MVNKMAKKKEAFDWEKVIEGFERPTVALIAALLVYYFSFDVSTADTVAVAALGVIGLLIERLYSHMKWQYRV
jgi:hypothetical protein